MAKLEAAADPVPLPAVAGLRSSQRLPSYTRSLLHIEVPVVVTLAAKKQVIGQILELGPGSIIHFDKSCDEMLDLNVGGHRIAQGEAVKVGDKFGLRVTSLILPEERFKPVAGVERRGPATNAAGTA
jgi:flagellar motor switch protein FliN